MEKDFIYYKNKYDLLHNANTISVGDRLILKEERTDGKQYYKYYIICTVISENKSLLDLKQFNLRVESCHYLNSKFSVYKNEILIRPEKYLKLTSKKIPTKRFEKGGNIDGDFIAHKQGNAGGFLVGKRHSEGGRTAVVGDEKKPIEMEGGEVVITRGAVNNPIKYEFDGKKMTTREILSELNYRGGGVKFMDGGNIPEKLNLGQDDIMINNNLYTPAQFVKNSEKEYQEKRLKDGIEKEKKDHYDTLSKLNSGQITINDALKEIALKEMSLNETYPY
jgi:hypothetical protein